MRPQPPLNTLRVFEVAARTGSYAEAAAELGLTHGAVSRQIAVLEGWARPTTFRPRRAAHGRDADRSRIDAHVKPLLGQLKANEVTRSDI